MGDRIRREHPSVAGIARQLGTTWNTVWAAVPAAVPGDGQRRVPLRWGVARLYVDEHMWHQVSERPNVQGRRGSNT
ncbi:MAG TPA: hypothetical protein VIJ07_17480 [Dermatophilaceae bacterium]